MSLHSGFDQIDRISGVAGTGKRMETQTSSTPEYNGRDAALSAPVPAPYLAQGKGESASVVYGRPGIGRIPVTGVTPNVDGGRWPAKAVVGETVEVSAVVFREGHDAVAATAVLIDPEATATPRSG